MPILSFAVKYASSYYAPFRDAAGSAPSFGDRKSYQMDFHNSREALREVRLDEAEGADAVIVKPALAYLDIIKAVASETDLPVAAYNVSGEYAMVKAAGKLGLINEYAVMCETAVAAFRAGASIYISYFAPELAAAIRKGDIG
jgi:porphobilinogen synthase